MLNHVAFVLAAMQKPQVKTPSLPAPFDQGFLDITDYRFMSDVDEDSPAADLGPACTGIVLHSLFGGADQVPLSKQ